MQNISSENNFKSHGVFAPPSSKFESAAVQKVALIAALIAFLLAISKLGMYLATGSLVIALSALDSFLDVSISIFNKQVIKFARRTANSKYPYGFGKAENVASLAQGMLIIGGSISIIFASLRSGYEILTTNNYKHEWLTISAALFFIATAFISYIITVILKKGAVKYKSPALSGDAEHYRSDVLTNITTALAILLIIFTNLSWLDPLLAILIALYMFSIGFKLGKESFDQLIDAELPNPERNQILTTVIERYPQIVDIHDFRGRRSGSNLFIDFHLTLPNEFSFEDVHEIVDDIEKVLHDNYDTDVVIHTDPEHQKQDPFKRYVWKKNEGFIG